MQEVTKQQLTILETTARKSARHASDALSKLINLPVKLEMMQTRIVEAKNLSTILASPEKSVTAVLLPVIGNGSGTSVLISSLAESHRLVELLTKQAPGSLTTLDELERSALTEAANIIGGAFLTEISNQTHISFFQSVPSLLTDTMKKILDTMVGTLDHKDGERSIAFEIDFELKVTTTTTTTTTTTEAIMTHYVFLLDLDFAQKLLTAMST